MQMGRFSFFQPKGEPTRPMRVATKDTPSDAPLPTADERTIAAAEMMLENQALERVISRLRQEAMATITHSQPGMTGLGVREDAHSRIRAIDEIMAGIQAIADERKFFKKPPEA